MRQISSSLLALAVIALSQPAWAGWWSRKAPAPSATTGNIATGKALSRAAAGTLINSNKAIHDAVNKIRQAHSIISYQQAQTIAANPNLKGTYLEKQLQVLKKGPQVDNFRPVKWRGQTIGYKADVTTTAWTPVGAMKAFSSVTIDLKGNITGSAPFRAGMWSPFSQDAIKAALPQLENNGLRHLANP
jgi:hypothetical protein